jgi:hypothetical protein
MEQINPLNIFEGPDSLVKYYDPDCQPPLPLVEIPDAINPFRSCGVRIYAKMMTALPAQNVKALPGRFQDDGPWPQNPFIHNLTGRV